MSFIQRAEQGFYRLTRLLSILLTVALLACAVVIGKHWLDVTAPETKPIPVSPAIPAVAVEDVVTHVIAGEKEGAEDEANRKARERMQKAILSFAAKYGVPADSIEPGNVIGDVLTTAADQESEELKVAYADGAAAMLEHALADPRVDGLIKKAEDKAHLSNGQEKLAVDLDAIESTLDELVTQYKYEFQKGMVPTESDDLDSLKKRDDTMRSMARTGGPLALLLLILQVLAFGRVDQSLRDIAHTRRS